MTILLSVIALAALGIAAWLWRARKKDYEDILLAIYVSLLELYGYHYWMVSLDKYDTDPEVQEKVRKLVRITADNVSRINHPAIAREIRQTLALHRQKTVDAAARYRAYGTTLRRLEEYIRRSYPRLALQISRQNLVLPKEARSGNAAKDTKDIFNAAGFIDWKPKTRKKR